MTDKQINKWLRRQFTGTGWILVAYYVLMNILVLLSTALDFAAQSLHFTAYGTQPDPAAIAGNAWGYIAAILAGFAILYAWKGPDYWWSGVWKKEGKMSLRVFVCCLSLLIGTQMVNSVWVTGLELLMNLFGGSLMPMLETVSGSADTLSMFLYSAIFAPIAEELLFRGYILRTLRPYGKRFAIFASAFLFGLFHGNLVQAPYAFLVGLLLGYVTVEYSLTWAVALHTFNNLVLADLFTRLTANLSDMVYGMINMILFGGFFLVSLAILIQKRQEIKAYCSSEWMDRRCVRCFFLSPGVIVIMILMAINMVTMFFMY